MSFSLFQANIPFHAVFEYLRLWQPGSEMSTAQWAANEVQGIAPGDVILILEPIYSPWGSAGKGGIGVGEGDKFRVSSLCLVYRIDGTKPISFSVDSTQFLVVALDEFLSQKAEAARGKGTGFYYILSRRPGSMPPHKVNELADLQKWGAAGNREGAPRGLPDPVYAFFTTMGIPLDGLYAHKPVDIEALGYYMIAEQEPGPAVNIPSMRGYFLPTKRPGGTTGQTAAHQMPAPRLGNVVPGVKAAPSPILNAPLMGDANTNAPTQSASVAPSGPAAASQQSFNPSAAPGASAAAPVQSTDGWTQRTPSQASVPPAVSPDGWTQGAPPSTAPGAKPRTVPPPPPIKGVTGNIGHGPKSKTGSFSIPLHGKPLVDRLAPPINNEDSPTQAAAPVAQTPAEMWGASSVDSTQAPPQPTVAEQAAVKSQQQQGQPAGQQAPVAPVGQTPALDAAFATDSVDSVEVLALLGRPAPAPSSQPAAPTNAVPQVPVLNSAPPPVQDNPQVLSAQGPPPKQSGEEDSSRKPTAQVLKVSRDQGAEKSAAGGLLHKLEQQSQRASNRLESKFDEIQGRLGQDKIFHIRKVSIKGEAGQQNISSLRKVLTRKLNAAAEEVKSELAVLSQSGRSQVNELAAEAKQTLDELKESLNKDLGESFGSVKQRAAFLSQSFLDRTGEAQEAGLAEIEKHRSGVDTGLQEIEKQHKSLLSSRYDHFDLRVKQLSESLLYQFDLRVEQLDKEIKDMRQAGLQNLDTLARDLIDSVGEAISLSSIAIGVEEGTLNSTVLLPKLAELRQILSTMVQEFREKFKLEVESHAQERLAAMEPVLQEKKERISDMLEEASSIRLDVERRMHGEFQALLGDLKTYVQNKMGEMKGLVSVTGEELATTESSIKALSDASAIENDSELIFERNELLEKLESIGNQLHEDVNQDLRGQIASLEDKGRLLQEELISKMEEDAYMVRKASENGLTKIRQAIKESHALIQKEQDHYSNSSWLDQN